MTHAWISKKSRNANEQPTCHDLLIVLRYAMKSRVIIFYWLSCRNSMFLFIAVFILCYSCSPSKYGRALNCQNLYTEMDSKDICQMTPVWLKGLTTSCISFALQKLYSTHADMTIRFFQIMVASVSPFIVRAILVSAWFGYNWLNQNCMHLFLAFHWKCMRYKD